ncbi:alpha-N-acetylneuraminide alpha-2,8-sialyltransferase-like [Patiria miniata]|uniref:Uncharacterized protein n=1 Tax=Patiria miniata TaxID=46514 RepID=A0A913ZV65_PATMI|nr:alpha-N-acetylneuraminide alpha-2,8-sialyltransferase-like [Patiria miniata]
MLSTMRLFLILRLMRLLTWFGLIAIILMVTRDEIPSLHNAFISMVTTKEALSPSQRRFAESLPAPVNVSLPTTPVPVIASIVRTFSSFQDEALFIYQKYILSNWKARPDRVRSFRREIFQSSDSTAIDQFVLTQQNTNSSTLMPFYDKKLGYRGPLYKPKPELLQFLPKNPIFPKGTLLDKCSVVGNGGVLLRSACGKEIDSADYVLRCNLVPIRTFGIDAGYKTNLTTMNPSIMSTRYHGFHLSTDTKRFAKALKEYSGHLFIPCMINGGVLKTCTSRLLPAILEAQKKGRKFAQVTIGNPKHLLGIIKLWKHAGINYMSTGFYLAQTALTMCKEVHLFGFWSFNRTFYPLPKTLKYHFFDQMAQSNSHKFNTEFQILWQQHAEGILKIHSQDCEE